MFHVEQFGDICFSPGISCGEGESNMVNLPYNRAKAVAYAHRWAHGRNPSYYDFTDLGGDCTNFISQCVYAGSGVVNKTPITGWYYRSLNDRAPAWAGVNEFYSFITHNDGPGPYALEMPLENAEIGDVIQLDFTGHLWKHSLLVVAFDRQNLPLIATHALNADNRSLDSYTYAAARLLHIVGVRK